ncbi:MAG: UDP-N-acetylglucosamine 2-epimerase (non-hydrolyzing) [SAR324 cluster bacterium]|nr:UDP-N-acetylglucosamine 2-epimerase (non-hydrolyzing) [SAR324 cluster bacterium]
MKKILSVFGTRPEAIKMAPVVKKIAHSPHLVGTVCITAQHRQMLDQVLQLFEIVPDYDLDLMTQGQDLTDITCRVLSGVRDVLKKDQPDLILVHGDTTTSFAAALAGFYAGIPVGHVEAGLRTYNLQSPFPEEANRQLTGRLSTWHFAPTEVSRQNLLNEGIRDFKIIITGNTAIDALEMTVEKLPAFVNIDEKLGKSVMDTVHSSAPVLLVTGHRRENFGQGFLNICQSIKNIALLQPTLHIIYPVHLNPNVQQPVYSLLKDMPNIHLIAPVDYLSFVMLLKRCTLVLTDSGGVQEEAPSLGKPVLVMRDTSERPEAIAAGTAKLVGTNVEQIVQAVIDLLTIPTLYQKMSMAHNPYGDGHAAQRIVKFLEELPN